MDLGIAGKVAMVAAGSKGIGLATAKALAAEGCEVSICGRNPDSLREAAQAVGPSCLAAECDVANARQIENWFRLVEREMGHAAILVTNTGGPPAGPVEAMTDEQWLAGFESTLLNIVRMVRLASPSMKESGWGRIVHITSLVAKEPNDLLPISSTLRTGINALTRNQSNALAPHGVTVNSVLPGHTLTDRQTHLCQIRAEKNGTTLAAELAKQAATVPIGRMGQPEEIAAAIVFLCSQQAAYITGTNVLVDGGIVRGTA